jgi:hypothetical protein
MEQNYVHQCWYGEKYGVSLITIYVRVICVIIKKNIARYSKNGYFALKR